MTATKKKSPLDLDTPVIRAVLRRHEAQREVMAWWVHACHTIDQRTFDAREIIDAVNNPALDLAGFVDPERFRQIALTLHSCGEDMLTRPFTPNVLSKPDLSVLKGGA